MNRRNFIKTAVCVASAPAVGEVINLQPEYWSNLRDQNGCPIPKDLTLIWPDLAESKTVHSAQKGGWDESI